MLRVGREQAAALFIVLAGCSSDNHGFSAPVVFSTNGFDGVPLQDLNGDGARDLFFGAPGDAETGTPGKVGIAVDTGSGFEVTQQVRGGDSSAGGDFNGDGFPDFAIAWRELIGNSTSSFLDVWINDGTAHFTLLPHAERMWRGRVQSADVDGDGTTDLFASWTEPGSFEVVSTLLFFGPDFTRTSSVDVIGFSEAADINRDGNIDLLVKDGIRLGDGTGLFAPPIQFVSLDRIDSPRVIDVNRDGSLDLVGIGTIPNDGVNIREDQHWFLNVLLGDGTGTFLPARTYFLGISDYTFNKQYLIAPFEPDGRVALVTTDGSESIDYYPADGDGYFESPITLNGATSNFGLTAVDYDGDRLLDLLTVPEEGDSYCVLYNER